MIPEKPKISLSEWIEFQEYRRKKSELDAELVSKKVKEAIEQVVKPKEEKPSVDLNAVMKQLEEKLTKKIEELKPKQENEQAKQQARPVDPEKLSEAVATKLKETLKMKPKIPTNKEVLKHLAECEDCGVEAIKIAKEKWTDAFKKLASELSPPQQQQQTGVETKIEQKEKTYKVHPWIM